MPTALVVGSGIAGLAAALRLRAADWDVQVVERRPLLGGKLHQVQHRGFTFDAGPSFLTQPDRLRELFALFGEELSLPIDRVDPSVHYHWGDRTRCTTPHDRGALVEQLARLGADPHGVRDYLDTIARQYDEVAAPFVESDVRDPRFWLAPSTVTRMTGSLDQLGRTFHDYNARWFPDAPKLVQLLDRYATYAGNDPYRAPAFMTSIADVELRQGIWYPQGGLRSIPEALVELGQRHGVVYRTEAQVRGLVTQGGRVTGVELDGGVEVADVVVAAIDPQHVAPWLGRERSRVERSTSAMIWFLGVEAVEGIGLHNIFFSDDYRAEFAALASGRPGPEPTVYINCSATWSPEHAPAGHQNWFVMINAPAHDGQDWAALREELRPVVLERVGRALDRDVVVVSESTYDPLDIAQTSGAFQGAIYGPSGNKMLDLFRKQPTRDPRLRNLVYCGGSSHPGGGMPMCLASARMATDAVTQSFGS